MKVLFSFSIIDLLKYRCSCGPYKINLSFGSISMSHFNSGDSNKGFFISMSALKEIIILLKIIFYKKINFSFLPKMLISGFFLPKNLQQISNKSSSMTLSDKIVSSTSVSFRGFCSNNFILETVLKSEISTSKFINFLKFSEPSLKEK